MVTGLEVDTHDGVGVETKIDLKDFETHVIIVHFIVAKGYVDIDSVIIFVFNEKFLVNLSCLFEMGSKIMKSSHTQLILNRV